eukprot:XP_017948161.1 PREDICTED: uncharacterized protein LOC108646244 [Xenopus tropicalis]
MGVILQLENLQQEANPEIGRVGVTSESTLDKFKTKSNFYPVHLRDQVINMFQKNIEFDLSLLHDNIKKEHKLLTAKKKDNLTLKEKQALKSLERDENIVIRKADKGGQIVILDRNDYFKEAHRQLSDSTTYKLLEKNPTASFQQELDILVQEALMFKVIDDKLASFFKIENPKTAIFHYLPKVHKKERPPPGRPIIAGIGSLGENLCEYIDHLLQPLVLRLPSYLRDSGHLLQVFQNFQWQADSFKWASIDVTSLYSCIPHVLGLKAIEHHLIHYSTYEPNLITFILKSIHYLLTHNFFYFDKKYYLQCCGTAMGAKFAPSYANLFLGWWEEMHIYNEDNAHSHNIKYFGRFIDDIILIWSGTEKQFFEFITNINTNDYNLKFTSEINGRCINFLDITLTTENEHIITSIFRKECSANTILNARSCHPKHLIYNIPYSQFLRLRRICSEEADFQSKAKDLFLRLKDRGYTHENLTKAFERAANKNRSDLFHKYKASTREFSSSSKDIRYQQSDQIKEEKNTKPLSCILTFSPQYNRIKKIINNNLNILRTDPILRQILDKGCRYATRRTETLKNKLSPSLIKADTVTKTWLATNGMYRCGSRQCITCNFVLKTQSFTSFMTNKTYKINHYINCNTKNVIYLLMCTKCNKQYIGQTSRKLKDRIREHILNITNEHSKTTVAKHFAECSNRSLSCLSVIGIDKVLPNIRGGDITQALTKKETKWVFYMQTRQPNGLNYEYDVTCYV